MILPNNFRPLKNGEKIDVAFLFQAGTVWPSWESVYKSCAQNSYINQRIILITRRTVEVSHNVDAEDFLVENEIPYEREEDVDFESYIPHIVMIQFPYDAAFHTPDMLSLHFKLRGSRVVYIPYGIEISDTQIARKDHFNSRVVENAWRIYTSSKGLKNEYIKYCRNRAAVRVTGSPKFDSIYNKAEYPLDKEYIKKANGRKIVVWKLHFPKKNNVSGRTVMITPEIDEYREFVTRMDEFKDFFFVVMPHPKILGKMTASDSQGDESMIAAMHDMLNMAKSKENAVIDISKDYRNSLYNADAIIMDRSAVMIEAAMLDVPVLIMKNASYDEPMTQPIQDVISTCLNGTACEDMTRFLCHLRGNVCDETYYRKEVVKKWFPSIDGKCGERIVEDFIYSINSESERTEKLRIILYGTGEVASYYMKDEGWGREGSFEVIAVSDTSEKKWGNEYFGYKVISPKEITTLDYDYVVVMTEPHFYDIQKYLINEIYLNDRTILRLDEFVAEVIFVERKNIR